MTVMIDALTLSSLLECFVSGVYVASYSFHLEVVLMLPRSVFGFITKQTITYRSRYSNDPLLLKTIVCPSVLLVIYGIIQFFAADYHAMVALPSVEALHCKLIHLLSTASRVLCALHVAINFWSVHLFTVEMLDLFRVNSTGSIITIKYVLTKYMSMSP